MAAVAVNASVYVAASSIEIEEFINGALVTWLESCLPRPEILSNYSALLDGQIIHSVWLQIDPEPTMSPQDISKDVSGKSLAMLRAKNFECIIRNLKQLFEEELEQTILVLPDWFILGYYPETKQGLEQMKLLLTLLLGAAVQCPNKEIFIARITNFNIDIQHSIAELIKQVTDKDSLVLTVDSLERLSANEMYNHVLRLSKERNRLHDQCIYAKCLEQQHLQQQQLDDSEIMKALNDSSLSADMANGQLSSGSSAMTNSMDKSHLAVELADLKSKLRKLRHELEEKSECNLELRELLEEKRAQYDKLRAESQEWRSEAKRASAYRDELDVLRERAERVERLELEIQKFKEKLTDSEFYKMRMEELREDNRMLLDSKDILEEQVQRWRKRCDHVQILEAEIVKYKQKLNDVSLERDADRSRLEELIEENTQLQLLAKNTTHMIGDFNKSFPDVIHDDCNVGDNSLSEQLNNSAQTRALRLELENRHLTAALDQLKETAFQESSTKILELEKEKKKMSLKMEQYQENIQRLNKQNNELEELFQNALKENKKMQENLDGRQRAYEKVQADYEVERCKVMDLEKYIKQLDKEKQRIQTLNESIQRRADDLEILINSRTKELEQYSQKLELYEESKETFNRTQEKLRRYERDNESLTKELSRLKETSEKQQQLIEERDNKIGEQLKELKQLKELLNEMENIKVDYANLQKQNIELQSQKEINLQTIETLRNDLVNKTLATTKVCKNLEKLGINLNRSHSPRARDIGDDNYDDLDNENHVEMELNTETVVKNLIRNPETFKTVCEVMLNASKEQFSNFKNVDSNNKSDICILCHRKEIFTVEKNIHLSTPTTGTPTLLPISSSTSTTMPGTATATLSLTLNDIDQKTLHKFNKKERGDVTANASNAILETDNARLKVDVATLGSQVATLNTQHNTLQLANTNLVNDKESLLKENEALKQTQKTLLHDHATLQCLHDQLITDYESLDKDKKELKIIIEDLKNDSRDMRRYINKMEMQLDDLKKQNNSMRTCNEDLNILRREHSKLTDDFRILFATSDRFKNEYKNIQEQYKLIRAENSKLKLQETELTSELNSHNEQMQLLQTQYVKSAQCCEMLIQQNANLDLERKTLMENVSHLLKQYHELLTYSLDDKKHFHEEEKSYTECIHNLSRQKEKLEEKIMELFKKSETVLTKKKPFASNLVRRVKKASTDLMNKVPNRNRRSWNDDSRLSQSKFMIDFESGGNDSDSNTEEIISRNSDMHSLPLRHSLQTNLEVSDVMSNNLTLEAAGSRRTVYLIDEHEKLAHTTHPNETSTAPETVTVTSTTSSTTTTTVLDNILTDNNSLSSQSTTTTTTQTAAPITSTPIPATTPTNNQIQDPKNNGNASTFLIYNRLNTTLSGGGEVSSNHLNNKDFVRKSDQNQMNDKANNETKQTNKQPHQQQQLTDDKNSSIWYEYGCV